MDEPALSCGTLCYTWVVRTILFRLFNPWLSTPAPTRSRSYQMPAAEQALCGVEMLRWLSAGYVRRLSPADGARSPWVSPSLVVHGGKDQLVVDQRFVNRFIVPRPFKYQLLAGFLFSLVLGDHLISWDVVNALYHIRIHPFHRKYFRFEVGGVIYEPRVLPFGKLLSPWAWTKVLRLPQGVVASLCRECVGRHIVANVQPYGLPDVNGGQPAARTSVGSANNCEAAARRTGLLE